MRASQQHDLNRENCRKNELGQTYYQTRMKIKNSVRWSSAGARSYAIAIAAIVIASGLRFALHPVLEADLPFLFFTIAGFLVAFLAGLWPALLVVASGFAIGTYFFVPPFNSIVIPETADLIFAIGYLSVSLLGIFLIESLQRAKYEARLLQQVAQSRLEILQRSNSERLRAEEATRQSEERFQTLASTLPHIWYMRRLDGNFEYVNDHFYQYTGLAPGSLQGNGWLKAIHPDDVERVKTAWSHVADTGQESTSGFRLRMADGAYHRFEGQVSRIEDKRGKIIKWVGMSAELQSHDTKSA